MAAVIGWHELYTSDLGVANFYAELLGAEIQTEDMGDFQYPMLKVGDKLHGGFVHKDKDHEQVPSHWYPYAVVDDVDASVGQAQALGSTLLHGPASADVVRFAVLMRPAARDVRGDLVAEPAGRGALRLGRAPCDRYGGGEAALRRSVRLDDDPGDGELRVLQRRRDPGRGPVRRRWRHARLALAARTSAWTTSTRRPQRRRSLERA